MLENKQIKITEKDYKTFRYFALLYDYSTITTLFWTTIISIGVLIDYAFTQRSLLIALIAIYILINNGQNIFYKMPKAANSEYMSRKFPNSNYAFTLTDSELVLMREDSNSSVIPLRTLHSAFETIYQFCFFISTNNYIILPKNKLTDEEKLFVRKTIFALPAKNRKNPFAPGIKTSIKNLLMILFITICGIILIIAYKVT